MRKLVFAVILLHLYASTSFAQQKKDSLWAVWKDVAQADTIRLNALLDFAWDGYLFSQPDSAFYFAQLHYDFAKQKGLKRQMANARNVQGSSFSFKGDYPNAIAFLEQSLKIQEEIDNKNGIASALNNIGLIYVNQGNYNKAKDYYARSLNIYEKAADQVGISTSLGNIGMIHAAQGDFPKAISFYTRSLKIKERIKDKKGAATTLNNIANIYNHQLDYSTAILYYTRTLKIVEEEKNLYGIAVASGNIGNTYLKKRDFTKAFEYFTKSLNVSKELGDGQCISSALNNIGSIYNHQGDQSKAIDYFSKSLQIREKMGEKKGIANSLNCLAEIYAIQNKHTKAIPLSERALNIAQEDGELIETKYAAEILFESYKSTKQYQKALAMHELYISSKDSILNKESQRAVMQQEFKYNYEKQTAIDSIKASETKKIADAQITAQKAQIRQGTILQYALFGGLFLVIIFAVFMYNRFRLTRKQNGIIEKQKVLVEEKHKEITDSINYAERIQRSFLATTEILEENLENFFVLFKPKDVVSGDFYWAGKLNNGNFAFSVADSTGHGVPGAIMSILNISSLEKSIENETEPNAILNKTRNIIIDRLKKDGSPEGGKDGMDCSLLVLNPTKTILTFAAAHNPVWIVRDDKLIEYKADKMPVGKHDKDTESFTLQTINLQKGDTIYTFTDGFADQFGGDTGKKYMIKKLKQFFLKTSSFSMKEQEQKLSEEFNNWKGALEQVDDVCVLGVKI